jgi:hypothetical protein
MFSIPRAPGRDPVDKRLLDDSDQSLLGSPPLRDEEGHVAALADLRHDEIDRPQPGVHPTNPRPRKIGRPLRRVPALLGSDLGSRFDPHHLRHDPLEHGQEGVRLRNELQ